MRVLSRQISHPKTMRGGKLNIFLSYTATFMIGMLCGTVLWYSYQMVRYPVIKKPGSNVYDIVNNVELIPMLFRNALLGSCLKSKGLERTFITSKFGFVLELDIDYSANDVSETCNGRKVPRWSYCGTENYDGSPSLHNKRRTAIQHLVSTWKDAESRRRLCSHQSELYWQNQPQIENFNQLMSYMGDAFILLCRLDIEKQNFCLESILSLMHDDMSRIVEAASTTSPQSGIDCFSSKDCHCSHCQQTITIYTCMLASCSADVFKQATSFHTWGQRYNRLVNMSCPLHTIGDCTAFLERPTPSNVQRDDHEISFNPAHRYFWLRCFWYRVF
ncbi:uncharacterized protein LOC141907247 isoform X2 [Tubulanus polymorphus]|uniref:uncharacterized protein LOC141907247 isoform X2 n=1 Tax=Tubulanus polymorphus TaxID=672921 RepID=UPI003DA21AC8